MEHDSHEISIPTLGSIKKLLDPIYRSLDDLKESIKQEPIKTSTKGKYYRNNHLKEKFGLSSNTIIKYRETGVLPFTKLGDIYLYEIAIIEKILIDNKISI